MLFCVPVFVSCFCNPGIKYVILCSWFSLLHFQWWHNVCFLCSWYNIPSLWPWPNVCYSMFLKNYPAPLTPTKCMLLHVSRIVSRPFNPGPMYVILCFWSSILPFQPQHNVWHSMFLIQFPAPSTLAQFMSFYVPDLVPCPCDHGTMYVVLYSWKSIPPLQPQHNVCCSHHMVLI